MKRKHNLLTSLLPNRATQRKRYLLLLAELLYTIGIMLFCAGSSPLIDNMKTDSSVFFTIGRSMVSGKIPYLDLFDHKGWYIYFFNYLAACLDSETTFGLFIIECLFMTVNSILFYKIADLIFGTQVSIFYKCFCSGTMLLFTLNSLTYPGGNCIETYGLTFQLISIYLIIRYYNRKDVSHPPVFMFFHGICAGVMLGLRANMVAMWGGIALILLIRLLIYKKYKSLVYNLFLGIAGVFVGLLPMILYCLKTHSLAAMIQQSLFFNLEYSSEVSLLRSLLGLFTNFNSLFILLGSIFSLIIIKYSKTSRSFQAMYLLSLLLSLFSVSLSGRNYGHYYEYIIPFFLPAALFITKKAFSFFKSNTFYPKLLATSIFALTLCFNRQTPARLLTLTGAKKISQPADSMAKLYYNDYSDKKTMLTVNNKCIFYNKFNLIPEEKFFYIPAINYHTFPNAIDAQAASVLSGKNDIIILSYRNYNKRQIFPYGIKNNEILQYLSEHYQMVSEQNHIQMYIKNN